MNMPFFSVRPSVIVCLSVLPLPLLATPIGILNPNFDGDSLVQQAQPNRDKPQVGQNLLPEPRQPLNSDIDLSHVQPAQLLANQALTEQLIQLALRRKEWSLLGKILPLYAQIKDHDPILLAYAQGALWRHQGQHLQAVRAYRGIIAQQPSLTYVRFDLAAMLYENKEYEAAKDQFIKIKADDIDASLRHIADQYLTQIQRKIGWNMQMGMQYVQNNNVNNASSIKEFNLGPYVFTKNEDALPKKGHGLSAFLALDRDVNIQGNHFATIATQLNGTRYWDESDYNEHTLRLESGYKHQDIKTSFSLSPFYEQSWLSEARYGQNIGLISAYSRWLSSNIQVLGAYTYAHKRYHDQGLQRYEGNLHAFSTAMAYFVSSTLIINGGIDHQIDHLNAEDESSRKTSARVGVIKEFTGGLSARTSLRYGQRHFDAPHFFLGKTRKDTEYQANVAVWHRQLHFKGITPKINYRYLKINSNLPAFYARQSQQWYVSLEKTF